MCLATDPVFALVFWGGAVLGGACAWIAATAEEVHLTATQRDALAVVGLNTPAGRRGLLGVWGLALLAAAVPVILLVLPDCGFWPA